MVGVFRGGVMAKGDVGKGQIGKSWSMRGSAGWVDGNG